MTRHTITVEHNDKLILWPPAHPGDPTTMIDFKLFDKEAGDYVILDDAAARELRDWLNDQYPPAPADRIPAIVPTPPAPEQRGGPVSHLARGGALRDETAWLLTWEYDTDSPVYQHHPPSPASRPRSRPQRHHAPVSVVDRRRGLVHAVGWLDTEDSEAIRTLRTFAAREYKATRIILGHHAYRPLGLPASFIEQRAITEARPR